MRRARPELQFQYADNSNLEELKSACRLCRRHRLYHDIHWLLYDWYTDTIIDDFYRYFGTSKINRLIIASHMGKPIAAVVVTHDHIVGTFVRPRYRRLGIGTLLIKEMRQYTNQLGKPMFDCGDGIEGAELFYRINEIQNRWHRLVPL
jgi:GNAT superfamily N-acetyltransferase